MLYKRGYIVLFILALICLIDADDYIFETTEFRNRDLIPTLSNGHLGFVAYGDAVHLNGLYNGAAGESHRARIPNYGRLQFNYCGVYSEGGDNCTYALDMRQGIFKTTSQYNSNAFTVELVTYPHRYYDKTIVNHLTITRNQVNEGGSYMVRLLATPGSNSIDLRIVNERLDTINGYAVIHYTLETLEVEDEKYQPDPRRIYIITETVPEATGIGAAMNNITYTWITSMGFDYQQILTEFQAAQLVRNDLIQSHSSEWQKFWDDYGITVEGNPELARSIHSSWFFLASALPSLNHYSELDPFYGLAPSGLGKGGVLYQEYQGHSFWDTEIWMLPPLILLEPKWSKAVLGYRWLTRQAAADSANNSGYKGLRFPWEGGYTGRETTPDCCPQNPQYQQHIIADIAFAAKSHFFATQDLEWMRTVGCELAKGTAEFWASRVAYNPQTDLYDIEGIMGPDEDNYFTTNNAFTNVVAAYNLFFGEFASCICNGYNDSAFPIQTEWSKIGKSISLFYDEQQNYIPQFNGFVVGNTTIKQADTVLLGYPLMYPMDESTQRNNLYIYGNATRNDGPAMTWAIHAIGHLDIGELPELSLFTRSYEPYIRKPFYVWNEVTEGYRGVGNFITGAGGFLQLIMNGYAGIRLHDNRLEIRNVQLPPNTSRLTLNGISYLNNTYKIDITQQSIVVSLKQTIQSTQTDVFINGILQNATSSYTIARTDTSKLEILPQLNQYGNCEIISSKINNRVSGAGSIKLSGILVFVYLIIKIVD